MTKYPRIIFKKDSQCLAPIELDSERLVRIGEKSTDGFVSISGSTLLEKRAGGNLAGHSFYLADDFDWFLGRDDEEILVLVPVRK